MPTHYIMKIDKCWPRLATLFLDCGVLGLYKKLGPKSWWTICRETDVVGDTFDDAIGDTIRTTAGDITDHMFVNE